MGSASCSPLSIPAQAEPHFAIALFSSVSGNDSCGVDTDARYNDTDLCWGPLRRVDVYRIYLVSVLSPAGAHKAGVNGGKRSDAFLSRLSPLSREESCTLPHSGSGVTCGMEWASRFRLAVCCVLMQFEGYSAKVLFSGNFPCLGLTPRQ